MIIKQGWVFGTKIAFCLSLCFMAWQTHAQETAVDQGTEQAPAVAPETAPAAAPETAPEAASAAAPAIAVPTAEEVLRVVEYYYKGKDSGPVLFKFLPCLKVEANECVQPLDTNTKVKAGTRVTAYMVFFVPEGGTYGDFKVQWMLNGKSFASKTFELKGGSAGSLRYRMSVAQTISKAGSWDAKVSYAGKELEAISFTAE